MCRDNSGQNLHGVKYSLCLQIPRCLKVPMSKRSCVESAQTPTGPNGAHALPKFSGIIQESANKTLLYSSQHDSYKITL